MDSFARLLVNSSSGYKSLLFGLAASKFPTFLGKLLWFFEKGLAKICTLESESMCCPAHSWGRTVRQVECFLWQDVLLVLDGSEVPAQLAQFLFFFEKVKTVGFNTLLQKANFRSRIKHLVPASVVRGTSTFCSLLWQCERTKAKIGKWTICRGAERSGTCFKSCLSCLFRQDRIALNRPCEV